MGHKVNPKIFRIGIIKTWPSKWFKQGQQYIKNLQQDVKLRDFLFSNLRVAGLDRVEIERSANKVSVSLFVAKPGLVIGHGGTGAEDLKKKLHSQFLKNFRLHDISLNIGEVNRPNLSANILAQTMALELEQRAPFRKIMKQTINRAERSGALGVKVMVSGRLNGAEIARTEVLTSGKVPLHTLRADIDYARSTAYTTFGTIGIKVWVYRGEVFDNIEEVKGEVVGQRLR
ncbi:MAG TPA: 30S ribosomal protein S3 [bacterium]|jgi:small subunit ribosomal protein S3|nr:30S ribosomal protein S3 [bacterium]HNZ51253.1 30S ribosomal protein S3 [bacterium]HOF79736.1 30S ribosomal protein S3 [bacterium]HOH85148.1 30S ribosomal protein S3 [bacterium]HOQ91564.1 30S ribosomal protein S3 [bacterium]